MKWISLLGVGAIVAALALASGCSQNKGCCGQCSGEQCATTSADSSTSSAQIAQKTCPVTGEAINPAVFTEYQGKKVYFCCKGCVTKFDKDPEKYAANIK